MIITLCGSARFENWYHTWNEILTISGHTVFALTSYPSLKNGVKDWYSEEEKKALDMAHLRKIDASEAILVLNVFAYIGKSTLNEINHAKNQKKRLYALESWGANCGIGSNHTLLRRQQALQYLGVECSVSPVDTFYPHFLYAFDLLPEAGNMRSRLVNKANSSYEITLLSPL